MDAGLAAAIIQCLRAVQVVRQGLRRSDRAEGHRPQIAVAVGLPQNGHPLDLRRIECGKAVHKGQRVGRELFATGRLFGDVGVDNLRPELRLGLDCGGLLLLVPGQKHFRIPQQRPGPLQRRIHHALQTGEHLAVKHIELHSRLQARPDFGHQNLAELKGNTALFLLQSHTPL